MINEKNVVELMVTSINDQEKREKRLQGHTTAYLTASSIVLLAEMTLFFNSDRLYCSSLPIGKIPAGITGICLLIAQLLVIALSYILLFPGKRANIGSPSSILKWYQDLLKDVENGASVDSMQILSDYYNAKYEHIRKDVSEKYTTLLVLMIVSISLIVVFSINALCLYGIIK